MRLDEIHIRDPFILTDGGKYYMYGTGKHTGGLGFDVYTSDDLVSWSEPREVFRADENFWATRDFWAPEVHKYQGAYYMFASFKHPERCRATQILRADRPDGRFAPISEPATPHDWECLDGTLYVEDGKPYIVFCHEWLQIHDGEIRALELSDDLTHTVGEPKLLFRASEPEWARKGARDYVTDGPFMYRTKSGRLLMLWASFSDSGYVEAIAASDNGRIDGKWNHIGLLFCENGGHGMLFRALDGSLKFILHQPNNSPYERPKLFDVVDDGDTLRIV